MISHLGFLVGGGDGDGDSGVVGASIYMYVLEVRMRNVVMYYSTKSSLSKSMQQ